MSKASWSARSTDIAIFKDIEILNKQLLIGRLGKDPEYRVTPTQKDVATLSIATTEKVGGEERTEWHRVEVWQHNARFARDYLKKGALVYVEGRTQHDKTGEGAATKYYTKVVADTLQALGAPNGRSHDPCQAHDASEQETAGAIKPSTRRSLSDLDDDIPF